MTEPHPPRVPGEDLYADVEYILGGPPGLIVDVGAHQGGTTTRYLQRFPTARAIGVEAETGNYAKAKVALAPFGDRARIIHAGVSDQDGTLDLHTNSHDGTHSMFAIGEQRYWAGHAEPTGVQTVPALTLDTLLKDQPGRVDLLHMDIQGGELKALQGAAGRLAAHDIALVYCEVEFHPLYAGQPLFWEIGAHLHAAGYHLYSLYDRYYHDKNGRVLSWSDALFVSNTLLDLPDSGQAPAIPQETPPMAEAPADPAAPAEWRDITLTWIQLPGSAVSPPLPQTFAIPALAWDYGAATWPIDAALVAAGATLKVDIEALDGAIGVSVMSSDGAKLLSPETPLEPYEGRVQIEIALKPRMKEASLLIRNYDADGQAGAATVYGVQARG